MQQGDAGASAAPESFGLKDIEPKTIPAVRSLISDVMFDVRTQAYNEQQTYLAT